MSSKNRGKVFFCKYLKCTICESFRKCSYRSCEIVMATTSFPTFDLARNIEMKLNKTISSGGSFRSSVVYGNLFFAFLKGVFDSEANTFI